MLKQFEPPSQAQKYLEVLKCSQMHLFKFGLKWKVAILFVVVVSKG